MNLNKSTPLIYVAGAYSGDIINNIKKAESISIMLIKNGFHVITPHKNTSGYEQYENNILTYQTWIDMDLNILSRCDAIYFMINGFESKGANIELEFAVNLGIIDIYESQYPILTLADYINLIKVK